MKKFLSIILACLMVLSLTACSGGKGTTPSGTGETNEAQHAQTDIKPAVDGVLTIDLDDAATVVNGTAVPMPYSLGELESAGVPKDESKSELEFAPGDFYSVDLYLDEKEDYMICPAYYNGGDDTINIADAQAEQISMVSFSDEPVDQDVSIFGVPFGMTKSDVLAMLGDPMYDNGDNVQWNVFVSDGGYMGYFTVRFTDDADRACVSETDLTLIEE